MSLEKIRCQDCKQFFDVSQNECECGWKISNQKTIADFRCGFEKKDGSARGCLNRGIIAWGNPDGEGFFMCDAAIKSWEEFQKIFWVGKKVICEKHYEILRFKGK